MEEERRLAYVGITRARQLLYLVSAEQRTLYGNSVHNEPSRFVEDVPPELVEVMGGRSRRSTVRAAAARDGAGRGAPSSSRAAFADVATAAPALTGAQQVGKEPWRGRGE